MHYSHHEAATCNYGLGMHLACIGIGGLMLIFLLVLVW